MPAASATPGTLDTKLASTALLAAAPASTPNDARAALDHFMLARLQRRDQEVLAALTDGLRAGVDVSAPRLMQPSNPCWYRYEILALGEPTPSSATARVRVYTHWWGGDVMAGPPGSWEQDLGLVLDVSRWWVSQVSPPSADQEEPGEPHGPTLSACNAGHVAGSPHR